MNIFVELGNIVISREESQLPPKEGAMEKATRIVIDVLSGGNAQYTRRGEKAPCQVSDASQNKEYCLSFCADHILDACGNTSRPANYCVSYTFGRQLSVIGAAEYDRIVFVDEVSESAVVYDVIADKIAIHETLCGAINMILGKTKTAYTSLNVQVAPDDFRWPVTDRLHQDDHE